MCEGLVKARILLEFKYYEQMKDLDSFKNIWDVDGVLFSFVDGEITVHVCTDTT